MPLAVEKWNSRFPFEMWLLPKKHMPAFTDLDDSMIPDMAACFQDCIRRLDTALEFPPYNYIIHTIPCNTSRQYVYHWHIEIIPRLTNIAGFEWGTGFYINPTLPERAAEVLRNLNNGED